MNIILNKSFFLLITLSSFILAQEGSYNYQNFNQSVGIQFDIGLNSFNSKKSEEYFEKSLEFYKENNVPLEAQTLYPSNILLGGGVYYFPIRSLSLSLSAEFTKTKAYSLYGDPFGTIDITSEINFFSVYAGLQKHFPDLFIFQPYLGIDAGVVRGEYNYQSKIFFNDFSEYSRSSEVDFSGFGFKAEAYIGASYSLDILILSIQGGYKYYLVSKPDLEDIPWQFRSENFPFDLEASGFVFKLILKTGVFW